MNNNTESKKTKKKRVTKKTAVYIVIGCLAAVALVCISLAVFKAEMIHKQVNVVNAAEENATADQPEEKPLKVEYVIDDEQYYVDMDQLQIDIEQIIKETSDVTGGEWSVCVMIPSEDETVSIANTMVINDKPLQAASVIKLFIMGAVYQDYDELSKKYDKAYIDELITEMIIISDNDSADELVVMLGRGDNEKGKKAVTEYCKSLGLENTKMERMIHQENDVLDNYTTTKDTADFLKMIVLKRLPHSEDMLSILQRQERKTKIPAGVPEEIVTANKTGELEDVHNDAAIIFADVPYIICVMSDGIQDYQTPIDAIVKISNVTYNYLISRT